MLYGRELEAVQSWVEATDRLAIAHFRRDDGLGTEGDPTRVIACVRGIDEYLRERIAVEFPDDAIIGERGRKDGASRRRWIIDPVNGEENYAHGIAVFATLIALQDRGGEVLALGMVSAPALGTRWWATEGSGAYRNNERIRVSQTARLVDAHVCTSGLDWAVRHGYGDRVLSLVGRARRHRGFGDFLGAVLVADGSMDVAVEFAPVKLWQMAACNKLNVEAGGRATTIHGEHKVGPSPIVTSNRVLHDEVLALLRASPQRHPDS